MSCIGHSKKMFKNKFTDHKAETKKQKWLSNKNYHKIYHIIVKKKEKKWHAKSLSKLLYFYIETFKASNFLLRDIKHDRKKIFYVHTKCFRFWWDSEFQ